MTALPFAAAALSALAVASLSALPEPRSSAPTAAPTAAHDDALLARVEREVTDPLRRRDTDRWRFSRAHRPTPVYRTVPDPERVDRRHSAFRIVVSDRLDGMDRVAWLVRVDRASGAIDLAPAPSEGGEPSWRPLAHEPTADPSR
jgi:hypothetical protein